MAGPLSTLLSRAADSEASEQLASKRVMVPICKAYLTLLDSIWGGIGRGTKAHLFVLESTLPQVIEVVNTAHSSSLHAICLQTLHRAHLKVRTPCTALVGDEAAHQISHGRTEGGCNVGGHVWKIEAMNSFRSTAPLGNLPAPPARTHHVPHYPPKDDPSPHPWKEKHPAIIVPSTRFPLGPQFDTTEKALRLFLHLHLELKHEKNPGAQRVIDEVLLSGARAPFPPGSPPGGDKLIRLYDEGSPLRRASKARATQGAREEDSSPPCVASSTAPQKSVLHSSKGGRGAPVLPRDPKGGRAPRFPRVLSFSLAVKGKGKGEVGVNESRRGEAGAKVSLWLDRSVVLSGILSDSRPGRATFLPGGGPGGDLNRQGPIEILGPGGRAKSVLNSEGPRPLDRTKVSNRNAVHVFRCSTELRTDPAERC
ncbi:hypothetical protein GWK47_031258 [Chionoecetes opilio]|uniref:Uncharacterized protein n=1 Tax=Chionoecetes opilio TaxID=41210 RepID=A0A8J5CQN7_CHIOP|nr:hypothetical protein GWK47_031258 [Chionoecetes opilio]